MEMVTFVYSLSTGYFLCFFGRLLIFLLKIIFLRNSFRTKILSGIPSECLTDLIQIKPDILWGLIWVQTVCKGYQQTTLVGKVLIKKKMLYCFRAMVCSVTVLCCFWGQSSTRHMIIFSSIYYGLLLVAWQLLEW